MLAPGAGRRLCGVGASVMHGSIGSWCEEEAERAEIGRRVGA